MSVVDKTYCEHYRDGLPFCAECEAGRIERLEQLQAELYDARAEIERLEKELRDNSMLAARQIVPAEMLVDDLTAEVERKDKMIEQMRRAIEKVVANFRVNLRDLTEFEEKQVRILEAALAAERAGDYE
jgi:SMC interacting uncharacterized protein involved in chromosome segregation